MLERVSTKHRVRKPQKYMAVMAMASAGLFTTTLQAAIVIDPVLATPPGAVDPVNPAANKGHLDVNVTTTATTGTLATKAQLEAVAGLKVLQRFVGFTGRLTGMNNTAQFTDPTLPTISFDLSGGSGTSAGGASSGSSTSGPGADNTAPDFGSQAIFLGNDNNNLYTISFNKDMAAVGLTISRVNSNSNASTWVVNFYDAANNVLARQVATTAAASPNSAALFAYIADSTPIRTVRIGRFGGDNAHSFGHSTTGPTGNGNTFMDDLAFAVVPEPASLSLLAISGLMALRRRR